MIDLNKKTVKALHALLKELYQSPAAKEFVDTYEREEHERRHETQAVPVNWSGERDNAYHDLTEAIFKREPLLTIQKAAETFVDICKREERRKPKVGEVYRDIFGNRYVVISVGEVLDDGTPIKKPFVILAQLAATGESSARNYFTVGLEDFMNPTFKKE